MKTLKIILFAVLLIFLLLTLLSFDINSVANSLKAIPLYIIFVLAALQFLTQILVNALWYKIAKITNISITFWRMMYINCQGAVVDAITPGVKIGGEATRAVQIKNYTNCTMEQAISLVTSQKLFSLSCFFLPLIIPILLAPNHIKIKRENKFFSFLKTLMHHLTLIKENKFNLVLLLLLSALIWFMYPFKLYIIAVQFSRVSAVHMIIGAFSAYAVAMLPLLPGGLGSFEATLTGVLTAAGLTPVDSVVITVLFRFITFWLVMLTSGLVVAVGYLYRKR